MSPLNPPQSAGQSTASAAGRAAALGSLLSRAQHALLTARFTGHIGLVDESRHQI